MPAPVAIAVFSPTPQVIAIRAAAIDGRLRAVIDGRHQGGLEQRGLTGSRQ